MDWIRHDWLWLVALSASLWVYVRMRTRRSPEACREVTGEECALEPSRTAGSRTPRPRR